MLTIFVIVSKQALFSKSYWTLLSGHCIFILLTWPLTPEHANLTLERHPERHSLKDRATDQYDEKVRTCCTVEYQSMAISKAYANVRSRVDHFFHGYYNTGSTVIVTEQAHNSNQWCVKEAACMQLYLLMCPHSFTVSSL